MKLLHILIDLAAIIALCVAQWRDYQQRRIYRRR